MNSTSLLKKQIIINETINNLIGLGFLKVIDETSSYSLKADLYYKLITENVFIVVNRINKNKSFEHQLFDCWISKYNSEEEIGKIEPLELFQEQDYFNTIDHIELLRQYFPEEIEQLYKEKSIPEYYKCNDYLTNVILKNNFIEPTDKDYKKREKKEFKYTKNSRDYIVFDYDVFNLYLEGFSSYSNHKVSPVDLKLILWYLQLPKKDQTEMKKRSFSISYLEEYLNKLEDYIKDPENNRSTIILKKTINECKLLVELYKRIKLS